MALEGDLQSVALPKVLHRIAYQHETGILTVQGEDDIVAVSFLGGQIVAADALNQTVEDGLGQILIEQELVSEEDFTAIAREHQGGSAGSLGDLLVSRQQLSRERLLKALRLQTYQLMLQVLGWRKGEYKFYSGDEVSYEQGFVPIPIEELVVRSLRDTGQPLPDPRAVYRRTASDHAVQVLGRDGDGSTPGLWLTLGEATFLAKLDGEKPTAAAAKECGLGKFRALHSLHRLLESGLIEPAAESEPEVEEVPLQAPIFHPPDELQPRSPAAEPALDAAGLEPVAAPAVAQSWAARAAAALLAAAAVLVLLVRPPAVGLPFPWQAEERSAVERQLRHSLFLKIDRAARTWFLLKADYPDSLEELVAAGLLAGADLRDPAGNRLRYAKEMLSYQLTPLDEGEPLEALVRVESIGDDFLLDPQFFPSFESAEAPLYLID